MTCRLGILIIVYLKPFPRGYADTVFAVVLWYKGGKPSLCEYIFWPKSHPYIDRLLQNVRPSEKNMTCRLGILIIVYQKPFPRGYADTVFAVVLWYKRGKPSLCEYILTKVPSVYRQATAECSPNTYTHWKDICQKKIGKYIYIYCLFDLCYFSTLCSFCNNVHSYPAT